MQKVAGDGGGRPLEQSGLRGGGSEALKDRVQLVAVLPKGAKATWGACRGLEVSRDEGTLDL